MKYKITKTRIWNYQTEYWADTYCVTYNHRIFISNLKSIEQAIDEIKSHFKKNNIRILEKVGIHGLSFFFVQSKFLFWWRNINTEGKVYLDLETAQAARDQYCQDKINKSKLIVYERVVLE